MKERLIDALTKLGFVEGVTLLLQGTRNPNEPYPDEFLTFWTNDTDNNAQFDNKEYSFDWFFTVIYYSNNPSNVNTRPAAIRAALKAAGFIPQGKGQDVPSDEPTHTGWAMDFIGTEENYF